MNTSGLDFSTSSFSLFKTSRNQAIIGLVLLVFMIITRSGHFGSAIKLPDASLAVLFLAGFYLRQWRLFPLYLLTAAFIDYVVIHFQGVSDFCVTPAYCFLIPTYAAMWFAGRRAVAYHALQWINVVCVANWVLGGALAAFFISHTSFYLLSGYVKSFSLMQYVQGFVQYMPRYVGYTLMYVGIAAFVHVFITLYASAPEKDKVTSH